MNLALITPWPPQATGIADYAYDLAFGLICAGHKVTVVTEEANPKVLEGVRFLSPVHFSDKITAEFDEIVYQMGNNSSFHTFMIRLLIQHPGVVHLHDMVLHHIMAWILYAKGDQALYLSTLNRWYGPYITDLVCDYIEKNKKGIWDSPLIPEIPFFEEVMQHATAAIMHSDYALDRVKAVFPSLNCIKLPQIYRPETVKTPYQFRDDKFHVGIFGGVDFNKRLDLTLSAIADATKKGALIDLHIVGSVSKECQHQLAMIEDLGLSKIVQLHGRLDHESFISLLSAVDLCVSLRYPSMGETSAIVMRAMQFGVPVIVNDVGWYSELPDFVPKLEPKSPNERQYLSDLLFDLASKGDTYQQMKMQAQIYAREELDFPESIRNYASFIHTA